MTYYLSEEDLTDVPKLLRELGQAYLVVDWSEGGHVHNWRGYIEQETRTAWAGYSDEARGLLYLLANQRAADEHWD